MNTTERQETAEMPAAIKREMYVIQFRAFGQIHNAYADIQTDQRVIETAVNSIAPTAEIIDMNIELLSQPDLDIMEDISSTLDWHNRIMKTLHDA